LSDKRRPVSNSRRLSDLITLKRHGRWRSGASVLEYLEEGHQFKDSAATLLFDF